MLKSDISKEFEDTKGISSKQSSVSADTIILPNDAFDKFVAKCEKQTQPNKALLEAAKFAKGSAIKPVFPK